MSFSFDRQLYANSLNQFIICKKLDKENEVFHHIADNDLDKNKNLNNCVKS